MIIANEIDKKYVDNIGIVKKLGAIVNGTLMNYCETKSYPFIWRYKSKESISEKIESGRFKDWEGLDDFYASTIIIPNLNEEEEVLQDVDKYFDIQNIIKRGTKKKAPDVFRFDSTRVIAKIKDYSEAKPVAKIAFEIQIKSAFEYAWSITTHSLTYKTNKPDWKRDRLAAQLKASVEQLDTLVLGFEDMSNRITESYHELSIEKVKLSAFIADLFDKKILPEEHFPKDMSRNCDNMLNLLYACPWYRKPYDKDRLEKVILFIRDKLSNLQHIPRTLSLFQLFYCCLAMEKDLSQLSDSYFSFITKDMISFMPKIEGVRQRFATETP